MRLNFEMDRATHGARAPRAESAPPMLSLPRYLNEPLRPANSSLRPYQPLRLACTSLDWVPVAGRTPTLAARPGQRMGGKTPAAPRRWPSIRLARAHCQRRDPASGLVLLSTGSARA
jgi:hypothetical protein